MSSLSDGRHYRELRNEDEIEDTTTDENALAVSSDQRIVDSDDLSLFPSFNEQRKRSQPSNQTCFTCITATMFSSLTEKRKDIICDVIGQCCKIKNQFDKICLGCEKCRNKNGNLRL